MAELSPASKTRLVKVPGLHPDEIAGKTILDVGSSRGEVCLAALKLGASRAVGIDPSGARVQAARRAAAAAGLNAEFIESDFETWEGRGTFDIVVCSNVLHQMFDPIHSLRRMMQFAGDKLVIEFATPTVRDILKYHMTPAAWFGNRSGLIAPGFARHNTNIYDRTYLVTPDAIRTILNRHNVTFEPVTIRPLERTGRFLAICNKRRIDHLTVIAGPTSSGKSTLYRRLSPELRAELGVPRLDSGYVTASEIRTLAPGRHEHVVLHYDLLRPFDSGLHNYERDIATELISVAKRVTFVTIFAAPDRLRKQIAENEIEGRKPSKRSSRHLRLLSLYSDPQFLSDWYQRWLHFCRRFAENTAGSFFVENKGDFEVRSASTGATGLLSPVLAGRPDAGKVVTG